MPHNTLLIQQLGLQEYEPVWRNMQQFTDNRDNSTRDEVWLVEHSPVFTLGMNGKPEHLLNPGDIPVVKIDRGGQVTYHGPGQLVAYLLIDIKRRKLGIRKMVEKIERAIIHLLADYQIEARGRRDAPGVYVGEQKIAALGLRVRRGCTYHGLALNVKMDLEPFSRINPCGYEGLEVTQLADLGGPDTTVGVAPDLCRYLAIELGYNGIEYTD
jgi:lipoyl(octanoyl) transferase